MISMPAFVRAMFLKKDGFYDARGIPLYQNLRDSEKMDAAAAGRLEGISQGKGKP